LTLRHLACDHAIDHHALDRYVLAGGRNAEELAAMRAMPRKTPKYLFPFTYHLVNHSMDIGERSAKRVNHLLKTFASLMLTTKRVDFNEINRHKIINSLKLTLVYNFLNKSADNRFVLFSCHKASSPFQRTLEIMSNVVIGTAHSNILKVCKAKMHGVVRICTVGEVSKTGKPDNSFKCDEYRIT
jgi:hypothetical protein